MEIYFLLLDWEGISLVNIEKLRFLVSLARHTIVNGGSSTAEDCQRIISGFGLFCPCEGITVNKFKIQIHGMTEPINKKLNH
jgi:hypothetical protein